MQTIRPRDARASALRFLPVVSLVVVCLLLLAPTAQTAPPNTPALVEPGNDSGNNTVLNLILGWTCKDPDGDALKYDIYLGTTANPPLVSSNETQTWYTVSYLEVETTYFWRVVAKDPGGLTTSGPTWTFLTRHNSPPYPTTNNFPTNHATAQPLNTFLMWRGQDPDGQSLKYDVYFGTSSDPPLARSDVGGSTIYPGTQTVLTTYYWRIVSRDTKGAETSGPIWSYTTKSPDEPPDVPAYPTPGDGATDQPINTVLNWYATDPENDPLNFDIYFGAQSPPPLVADHATNKAYDPGPLSTSTVYRWKVVSRDPAGHETSGPVWTFTSSKLTNVPPFVPSDPGPPNGGTSAPNPVLTWTGGDPDGDSLQYYVFMYLYDTFPDLIGTTTETHFQTQNLVPGFAYTWYVMAFDGHWYTQGPLWQFGISGDLPVLFHTFSAKQSGNAVEIRWSLSSDEAVEKLTVYRREGATGTPRVVMEGAVSGTKGSFIDRTAEPAKTYIYDMVVHATSGNDFRSSLATVTMPDLALALYQNQPNPFNPQTTIRYDLPGGTTRVRLLIVDLAGRRVRTLVDEKQSGGARSIAWNGHDDGGNPVASGVYFCVLYTDKERLTRKLVLLK